MQHPLPLTPSFDQLPMVLPIFPLPGAIILPRVQLPLNIFEPRYLSMTLDALGQQRLIGMIQPRNISNPFLYPVGCAGKISSFSETGDGRLLIVLTGICRFRVTAEIAPKNEYRRITPDWKDFKHDFSDYNESQIDVDDLISQAQLYCQANNINIDWKQLPELRPPVLVNVLSCQLPLSVRDKQSVVEISDVIDRRRLLQGFCKMNLATLQPTNTTCH